MSIGIVALWKMLEDFLGCVWVDENIEVVEVSRLGVRSYRSTFTGVAEKSDPEMPRQPL